jgi:hypothetical protein
MNLDTSTPANDRTDHTARPVARAILSTLDAPSAVFVLATLAAFARAIVDAAALLRQSSGDAAEATARAMLSGALDGFDRRTLAATDPSTHTFALAAAWWFAAPAETVAAFRRGGIARTTVEEQARAALVDVEALRVELGREVLPLEVPAAPVEARASNDGGALLPRVAMVLYMTEPAAPGHEAIASGLAALVAGVASGEDASGLVRGLAELAAHRAGEAGERLKVDGAAERLAAALDALDAGALVARVTLAALRSHHGDAAPHSVEVRAA